MGFLAYGSNREKVGDGGDMGETERNGPSLASATCTLKDPF